MLYEESELASEISFQLGPDCKCLYSLCRSGYSCEQSLQSQGNKLTWACSHNCEHGACHLTSKSSRTLWFFFTENTIGTLGLCLFSLDMILLSFHVSHFRRKLADVLLMILIYGEFLILTHLVKFPGWCLSNRFVANRMLGFIRLALLLAFWQIFHGHLGLRLCWWAPTHLHITQVWAQRQPRDSPWWPGSRDSWKSVQTALHPPFNGPR